MFSPQHYRCEENVVTLLEKKKLSLNALRIVHATYHYLDNHTGWTPASMALEETPGKNRTCTVLCATLCQTTGSPSANDIGMIHDGLKGLNGTDLFSRLEVDGRKLRFRFANALANATKRLINGKFAMLDCGIIAQLRSPWHVYFYTRAEMAHQQKYPFFYLPNVCPDREPWSETKRKWLSAACRVGEFLGQHYVFVPELDEQCEYVIRVKVKIVTAKSQWSAGRLYPRHAAEPVSIVARGKSRTLTRDELRERKNWTLVDGKVSSTQVGD